METRVREKFADVQRYVLKAFEEDPTQQLEASEVYKWLRMDKSNFRKLVNSEQFQAWRRENRIDYKCLHKKGRSKFFVKRPEFDVDQFPDLPPEQQGYHAPVIHPGDF